MKKFLAFLREEEILEVMVVAFLCTALVATIALYCVALGWPEPLRTFFYVERHLNTMKFWVPILESALIVAVFTGVAVALTRLAERLEDPDRKWHR